MGKIGIAPHQQTLNLYYFNKYINFVIKLLSLETTFNYHFPGLIIEKRKVKYEELNMKKSLYVSFQVIFCPACYNKYSYLNKFYAVSDANIYSEE
jgi:hypothetical protein